MKTEKLAEVALEKGVSTIVVLEGQAPTQHNDNPVSINGTISEFKENNSKFIENCIFESIDATKTVFEKEVSDFNRISLQEFEVLFDDAVSYLTNLLNSKIKTLTEQEQIRIDNLLIQEKNAENSRIQEWQRTWNANIDTLKFDDVKDVKSVLVKSKLANLKHYSNEYEEIYDSTEKRLNSQIELISKAETQRIAQEKFQKEKAEFEAKQLEAKFQERKKYLIELGMVDDGKERLVFEDMEFRYSQIKEFSEDNWHESIEYIGQKISEFNQSKEEVKTDEIAQENYHEEDVHEVAAAKPIQEERVLVEANDGSTAVVSESNLASLKDSVVKVDGYATSEVTWESIWEEYRENIANYDEIKTQEDVLDQYIKYLEVNYNAPTKKQ